MTVSNAKTHNHFNKKKQKAATSHFFEVTVHFNLSVFWLHKVQLIVALMVTISSILLLINSASTCLL